MADARVGSHPIPVMSIPAGLTDLLETCAKNGGVMVGDHSEIPLSSATLMAAMTDPEKSIPAVEEFRNEVKIYIQDPSSKSIESFLLNSARTDPMSGLVALLLLIDWAHLLGDDRACTMVIVNKGDTPLDFSKHNSFNGGDYHGKQTAHPALMTKTKGVYSNEYIIPAASDDDGVRYYGLGMFKFQKSAGFMGLGWYGTEGAIGADIGGGNSLKIAFLVGQSGTTTIAASVDSTSLDAFLTKNWSPDKSNVTSAASSSGGKVHASMYPAAGLYLNEPQDYEDMAATIVYTPK